MTTVARIIASKPNQTVHSVPPDVPVLQAIKMMAEHSIGALLVMQDDKIVGILSERDYARKIVLMGRSSETTPVKDIMTVDVMYVGPEESNTHCMAIMTENRLRHLPVLDKGRLVGLISIGDLVKDIISEQQFVIEQLEHYIRGDR